MSCYRKKRCCKCCCRTVVAPTNTRIPRAVKLLLLGTVLALAAGPTNAAGPARNTNIINIGNNPEDYDYGYEYECDCQCECKKKHEDDCDDRGKYEHHC